MFDDYTKFFLLIYFLKQYENQQVVLLKKIKI